MDIGGKMVEVWGEISEGEHILLAKYSAKVALLEETYVLRYFFHQWPTGRIHYRIVEE